MEPGTGKGPDHACCKVADRRLKKERAANPLSAAPLLKTNLFGGDKWITERARP
jgi:hypothetical protein